MANPYPLEWPTSWARTPQSRRKHSRFRNGDQFGRIRDEMFEELQRFGASHITLSTDIPVRLDGLPRANAGSSRDDPGAAIYFHWRGKPLVIACDSYVRTWENIRAITKTVESMRAIDRHGASQILERAVSGFTALPAGEEEGPPPKPWWVVLGIPAMEGIDFAEVGADDKHPMRKLLLGIAEMQYKAKIPAAHPDRGGAPQDMRDLSDAIDGARSALGKVVES